MISRKARNRLDPAHPSCNRAFRHDTEQPDLARTPRMRPTAQLHRVAVKRAALTAHLHHTNGVTVFVAEKLENILPGLHLRIGHFHPAHMCVFHNLFVHQTLHFLHLLRRECRARKIERQFFRTHKRTLLSRIAGHHPVQRPMQEMRHRVMPLNRTPPRKVDSDLHMGTHFGSRIVGAALDEVQPCDSALRGVGNAPDVRARAELSRVPHLSAQLRIGRRSVQHHRRLVLERHHLKHLRMRLRRVVSNEMRGLHRLNLRELDDLLFLRRTRALALLIHETLKARCIDAQPQLPRHQLGEVQRKTRRVVQLKCKRTRNLTPSRAAQLFDLVLKKRNAAIERFIKRLLLAPQHLLNDALPGTDFRKHIPHVPRQHVHELVEKRIPESKHAPVPHSPAQNPAEYVVAVVVARLNPVGDREGKRADVISDDSERHVDLLLSALSHQLPLRIRTWKGARVALATHFFELVKNRAEHVRLIVGDARIRELGEVLGPLNDRAYALKAHPGVNVLRRQRRKRTVRIRIKLDEHQIPNLDALRRAQVHKRPLGVSEGRKIHMQFGARPAGARVAHHPKIVLLVPVDDMNVRIQARAPEKGGPQIPSLLVPRGWVTQGGIGLVNRGV